MIKDCLRIFEKDLAEKTDALILDNYVPKDGTYLLIKMESGSFIPEEPIEIRYDKRNDRIEGDSDINYKYLQQLDYYSKLVEMNKPIDSKKTIHSNQYLSFFLKKESLDSGKVTIDVIDGYFEILKSPRIKYEKKKKALKLYELVEAEIGQPDTILIQQIQNWIKENLFELSIDKSQKNYLKLFFVFSDKEKTIRLYQQEGKRYLLPNIYNNNESNIILHDKVYGLPNDNIGMNAKKPYLEHKTRKVKEPYLLGLDEVLLQGKFFDYLMGQASIGRVNAYVDLKQNKMKFYKATELPAEFKSGIFLRIQKGKEVEIHSCDVIPDYNYHLKEPLIFKEIIPISEVSKGKSEAGYGPKKNLGEMQILINDVFFGKWLSGNYFTDPGDISLNDGVVKFNLLRARERLFAWFYKGSTVGLDGLFRQISLELVKNSIANGNYLKAKYQMNLRWSLMDYFAKSKEMEERMAQVRDSLRLHINTKEDWEFENEREYYYAVGQLVAFFISKTKGKKVPQSFVNPFLNAKRDEIIKKRLKDLYKKVNYDMEMNDFRAKNLTGHVMTYQPQGNVDQDMLIGGFNDGLLIFEKKVEDK